jgi:uncharacterized membrane protein
MSSSRTKPHPLLVGLVVLGGAYPFVVYATLGSVPAGALVLLALSVSVARLAFFRDRAMARPMVFALLGVAVVTAVVALLDAMTAAKLYPVLMSLAFAGAFGLSLIFPPSLIEAMALRGQPEPAPAIRRYMRRLSLIWCLFLLASGAVSAITSLGELWLWTLYNGLISYLLMGVLLGGEWLVRRRILAREARS